MENTIATLNKILSSEYVLLVKTRQFHWNLKSENFIALHKLLGDHYEQLSDFADEVAERVAQLDGLALGSMQEFISDAFLKEYPTNRCSDSEMVQELIKDHDEIISQITPVIKILNDKLNDPGTADMLTQIVKAHAKMKWFLKSTLDADAD